MNLVSNVVGFSDSAGTAAVTDPNLKNPWGIAFSPSGPFWIADNGTSLATVYNGSGAIQPLVIAIPGPSGPGAPTGEVYNGTADFAVTPGNPAIFLFSTEDGTIVAWQTGTSGVIKVNNSASGAIYKGLAIGNNGTANFIYAANFHSGAIDVFDRNFAAATLSGSFTDPAAPAGFAPFNIANIGGQLFVAYAKQDAAKKDDVAGPGNGFVDVFDTNGRFVRRFASGTAAGGSLTQLNAPWGLLRAPASFGPFGDSLLVGNFGDGRINAFDRNNGSLQGQLQDTAGAPIVIPGLWALTLGNGGSAGQPGVLYFTAGINDEQDGLFGSIQP